MDGINVSMHPETVAVLADLKKTVEKSSTTRATRAIRHKAEHQSLRQSISAPNPLALTDGNRRKSSRAKPSDKERENIAQQQEGITVHDDGTVDITVTDTSEQSVDGPALSQWAMLEKYLDAKFSNLERQNAEIIQQNLELRQGLLQSQQRVEELQICVHQLQEQNFTGLKTPYLQAAMQGATTPEKPILMPPKAEELFCTIDFSRVEGNEVNIATMRKKIEGEIQKGENKSFQCKAITRDHRTPHRVRVLCRSEEELDIVKQAANTTAVEGTRILRDQLYPVKVDNVRANAVLFGGNIREDLIARLNDSNNTQISKVSWLSSRNAGKAYGSMVVFFTKGSEAQRFLQESFITVGGESASVRVFEPATALPRCYNCQGIGHKAYGCKERQRCGNCAQYGHEFKSCVAEPKCVTCSGPHTVMSRHCPKRAVNLV